MKDEASVMESALRSRIRDLHSVTANEFRCILRFDADFAGFDGHFEGHPIVPGVCLIEAARLIAEETLAEKLRTAAIPKCRFRRPILAGEEAAATVKASAATESGIRMIQAEFRVSGAVSAQMRLEVEPA